MVDWFGLLQTDLPPMTVTYLETLNLEQRRAVEHGVRTRNTAPDAALASGEFGQRSQGGG
jgi:hypothetical protein